MIAEREIRDAARDWLGTPRTVEGIEPDGGTRLGTGRLGTGGDSTRVQLRRGQR
jgi:hypothetical protein